MSSRTTLFGPPGSGKTTTLSKWARQAAEKHGGENVMICSLTRTAATEIQSRNTDVPKENVGTLHAHAYRSVTAEFEGRYHVISDKDIDEFNEGKHALYRIPKMKPSEDDPVGTDSIISKCDLARSRMIPLEKWPTRMRHFWGVYSEWKRANHLIDFTDMIEMAIESIDCPLDYVILDEAQDSSALEYALLEKWASQCQGIVIAGDDDQAAYEWRGASVSRFLAFSEDQRVLPRTYRMSKKVKEFSDRWIHQIRNRKEKSYEATDEIGQVTDLDSRSPQEVVEFAATLSGTTMILVSCGYMTNAVLKSLQELAIPYHNPYRVKGEYASSWNPLLAGGGSSVTSADVVRSFLETPWTYATAAAWIKEMSAQHLSYGTKALLKRESSNESLVPLDTLSSWLGPENLSRALTGDFQWWLTTIKDKKKRDKFLLRHRLLKNLGPDGPQIIVGTIHSVKGGQADNVILYPDLSTAGREGWNNYPDAVIRQMYIGMTRAKTNLYLVPPTKWNPVRW